MQIDILEKRIARERFARKQAEELLEDKSCELYKTTKMLRSTADQLSQQTSQLNVILDNALSGIVLTGAQYRIVRANQCAEQIFGYESGSLFGSKITEFISNPSQALEAFAQNGGVSVSEIAGQPILGKRSNGECFPLELSVSETEIRNQKHCVWIFRDITVWKEQEAERHRLEEELRQAHKLEALGTLASGIAHEINTPIQFIGDNLYFLQEAFADLEIWLQCLTNKAQGQANDKTDGADIDFLKVEVPAAIAQSLEGIARVSEIVTSVRDFSHPGSQDKMHTDLNRAIQSTITISTNQWKYVANVETDLDPSLPKISCVAGEINQVILNLIVNAAQAIEEVECDGKGLINIKTHDAPSYVEILIEDSGCGIKPENQSRVFDPFFTTKDVGKGTGQGLSLAHNIIVQKHKGKISFESEVGKGTTFTIRLPKEEVSSSEQAA